MIDAFSQLGILMLLLGMETAFRLVRNVRRNHISTSTGHVIVPFAARFGLGTSAYGFIGWREYA